MKITKKEVKTIYSVELSFKDYCELRTKAKGSTIAEVMGAFADTNLDDETMGTLKNEFCNLQFKSDSAKTLQYIVRELGFDGIENYGYHKEKVEGCGVHKMVVYNEGDEL